MVLTRSLDAAWGRLWKDIRGCGEFIGLEHKGGDRMRVKLLEHIWCRDVRLRDAHAYIFQ